MSITDASTNLDTAYTEQSTVAFTAGKLSSISLCVAEVESKLKRGTLSTSTVPTLADVQRWLSRRKQELAEVKSFTWRRRFAYADTVSGQYRYSLPPDFQGGWCTLVDTTNGNAITLIEPVRFEKKNPSLSTDSSSSDYIGTIKDRELWLSPAPESIYRLELQYDRSGDDVTENDISWLPEIERFRICDGAIAEAFASLHMWNEARYYEGRWNQGIVAAIRADGKKRWHGMNYQGMSIFQTSNYRIN